MKHAYTCDSGAHRRCEPGIQNEVECLHLDSGSGAISAFTRVFDALWRRPGMTLKAASGMTERESGAPHER